MRDNLRIDQWPLREFVLIAVPKPIPIKGTERRSGIAAHQKSLSQLVFCGCKKLLQRYNKRSAKGAGGNSYLMATCIFYFSSQKSSFNVL